MHRMQRSSWLLVAGLGLALLPLRAETLEQAVRAMTNAEKKFYETGQEKGTRAAFLEFLAPDGIVFRPGPVNGQEAWSKRPESGLDLVWEPSFAAIARSADFGYDTGPAKWRASKKEEKFTGHGQFVSIWKKQKDGSWKVALDCGIENPEPTGKSEPLRFVVPENGPNKDSSSTQAALQKTQNDFITIARLDFSKAFREFGSSEVRLYRDGSFPTVGKDAGARLLGTEQAGVALVIMKTDVSSSADLAYNYGKYSDTRSQPPKAGHFFQVWQTDATGMWKLVLDWQQPLPPPPK
jgi:ketosteroid isomerase-like protein